MRSLSDRKLRWLATTVLALGGQMARGVAAGYLRRVVAGFVVLIVGRGRAAVAGDLL
jgi:hypothetical protein